MTFGVYRAELRKLMELGGYIHTIHRKQKNISLLRHLLVLIFVRL